ncbi:MAG: c-type cytochrome [Gallionella sp.]|nr:c-type cytochrome [Gallionella sp.]
MRQLHLSSFTLIAMLCACQPESSTPAVPPGSSTTNTTATVEVASAVAATVEVASEVIVTPEKTKVLTPVVTPPSELTNKTFTKSQPVAPPVAPPPPVVEVVAAAIEKVAPVVPTPAISAKSETQNAKVLAEADALQLAKKSGCLTCHAIEKKLVGPAWRDVATKYRGDAGAPSALEGKVAKGGKGAWGNMAMPANSPRVSDADIHALVGFILSLK